MVIRVERWQYVLTGNNTASFTPVKWPVVLLCIVQCMVSSSYSHPIPCQAIQRFCGQRLT
jgi:hypothetical protein